MKVTVTHLKAPWPAGTVPGHVVELLGVDAIPAWALGKCVEAADDSEAVSTWTRPGFEAPAELAGEPAKAPEGELVVNPEAAAEAQAAAGSGDAAAPAAEAAAPAAAPARRTKAQAAAG
jgi:hypothetical protein